MSVRTYHTHAFLAGLLVGVLTARHWWLWFLSGLLLGAVATWLRLRIPVWLERRRETLALRAWARRPW